MKNKIKAIAIQFLSWVLIKIIKVRPEFLSPLSWKVVGPHDLLLFATHTPNVLVLKSSPAMNFQPTASNYDEDRKKYQGNWMYNDESELTFLFANRIRRTTNNNLRYFGRDGDDFSIQYGFKFKLITVNGRLITFLITKVIKYNTTQLLSIARSFNKQYPVKKVTKSNEFELISDEKYAKVEKEFYEPENHKNTIESPGYKQALKEEAERKIGIPNLVDKGNIEKTISQYKKKNPIKKVVEKDGESLQNQIKMEEELRKEWGEKKKLEDIYKSKNFKN